jgi:hypothetical protein
MNCFRHPDELAAAYCKGCGRPLCLECYEQPFDGETHVCSAECAETARRQPNSEDAPDTPFDKMFAKVFVVLLVVVLGGGVGGFLFAFRGSIDMDRIDHPPSSAYAPSSHSYRDPKVSIFRIFHDLGITDWRILFAIGAVLGIGCVALFVKTNYKVTVSVCVSVYAVLKAWTLFT